MSSAVAYAVESQKAIPVDGTPIMASYETEEVNGAENNRRTDAERSRLAAEFVEQFDFPQGLANLVINDAIDAFPERIWIVDNSGSMSTTDGHYIISRPHQPETTRILPTSRWIELRECVLQHGSFASTMLAPTEFRLLNPPPGANQIVKCGFGRKDTEMAMLETTMQTSPVGCTPLTQHVHNICSYIMPKAAALNARGQNIVVTIATDGVPSDNQGRSTAAASAAFKNALRGFEGLPVFLIIRLCTDDDSIVNFWAEIDSEVELTLEVLDDYVGEAGEVHALNPWLVYGLPLHRAREFGIRNKYFDLLDERKFSMGEMHEFLNLLLAADLPNPAFDWDEFEASLTSKLQLEPLVYNPIKKRPMPWVDIRALRKCYTNSSSCTCA